jgi:hypothetical protein
MTLLKFGDYTDAFSTLNAALALNSRDDDVLYNKALVPIEFGLHTHNLGDLGKGEDDKDAVHMKTLLTKPSYIYVYL